MALKPVEFALRRATRQLRISGEGSAKLDRSPVRIGGGYLYVSAKYSY
jgi:hypothetical protein